MQAVTDFVFYLFFNNTGSKFQQAYYNMANS